MGGRGTLRGMAVGVLLAAVVAAVGGLGDGGPGRGAAGATLGGHSLRLMYPRISFRPITLQWNPGDVQAGYTVYRIQFPSQTTDFLPAGGLPGDATLFVDESLAPYQVPCYSVIPLNASGQPLGNSDALCALRPTDSVGSYTPGKFGIALSETATATLWWELKYPDMPVSSVTTPLNGGPTTIESLPLYTTAIERPTNGVPTCYATYVQLNNYTGALCAIPGAAHLTPAQLQAALSHAFPDDASMLPEQ